MVSTTSTLQSKQELFNLKHFTMAIIDEASQILEPDIVGLLAAHNDMGQTCIDKFVLVGDYKQLPAVVQQDAADTRVDDPLLQSIALTDCRNSSSNASYRWNANRGASSLWAYCANRDVCTPTWPSLQTVCSTSANILCPCLVSIKLNNLWATRYPLRRLRPRSATAPHAVHRLARSPTRGHIREG